MEANAYAALALTTASLSATPPSNGSINVVRDNPK